MTSKILNKVVHGGPAYKVPAHLNFGQYVIDKLRLHSANPDGIALINGDTDEKITWDQLLQCIVNTATGLKCLGVERGDVVGICSERSIEYIVSILAAICCGATVTVFSKQNTPSEMKHILNISHPKTLICSKSGLEQHIHTFKGIKFIKHIVQINDTPIETNIHSYKNLNIPQKVNEFEAADVQGCTDGLFILYSSGSTGMSKGVVLTHWTILYAAAGLENDQTDDQFNQNFTTILTLAPWFHAYGLFTTVFSIILRTTHIFCSSFNIRSYLSVIEKYKPSILAVVPSIIVALAKAPIVQNYDVSSVNLILSSSAPLNTSTVKEALAKFPNCLQVLNTYGMTEIPSPLKNYKMLPDKPNTIGYTSPGMKMKIVDVETETKLGPNEKGEIRVKGPLLMKGYANNEIATKESIDSEGYLKTGDIGFYDEDGYFFIADRLKNLIKYKGYQVSPTEVESVLLEHPHVEECGVVGTPDDAAGELPTAFVVVKEGERLSTNNLLNFANGRLSPNKRVRGGIIFVKKIPKTKTGKILHRALKNLVRGNNKSKL